MARAAEYAPRIREVLEQRSNNRDGNGGITVSELAGLVGCSTQQVYKVLGQLGTKKTIIGQSPTGAYLYRYDPNGEEAPKGFERKVGEVASKSEGGTGGRRARGVKKGQPRRALLQINDLVTVKGVRALNDTVEYELENEDGERVRVVIDIEKG